MAKMHVLTLFAPTTITISHPPHSSLLAKALLTPTPMTMGLTPITNAKAVFSDAVLDPAARQTPNSLARGSVLFFSGKKLLESFDLCLLIKIFNFIF